MTETDGLQIRGISKSFGKRHVLTSVNLHLQRGDVAGLLGPNGAGKTTCFYIVAGLVKPDSGGIFLDGADLTDAPMYQRSKMGITYLAQEASIFRGMTVEQNVMSVAELHEKDHRKAKQMVDELLDELRISHLRRSPAFSLSGGERRRAEVARALASRPSFLLMDEPFAGLDPLAVDDIRSIVLQLRERNLGILITDHNVKETLEIVDRASIIYDGEVLLEGSPRQILSDPEVRRVYLGESYSHDAVWKGHEDEVADGALQPVTGQRLKGRGRAHDTRATPGFIAELKDESLAGKTPLIAAVIALVLLLLGGLGFTAIKLDEGRKADLRREARAREAAAPARGAAYASAFAQISNPALWKPLTIHWLAPQTGEDLGVAPVTLITPGALWGYGGNSQPLPAAAITEPMILRVDITDIHNSVGISLVRPSGEPIISAEQQLTSATGRRAVFFQVGPQDLPAEVLVRNFADASGEEGAVTVSRAYLAPARSFSADQMKAIRHIGLNRILPSAAKTGHTSKP